MYVCVTVIFTCDDASWCGMFITWTSPVGWWYVLGISTAGVGSFWVVSCSVSGARKNTTETHGLDGLDCWLFFWGGKPNCLKSYPFVVWGDL